MMQIFKKRGHFQGKKGNIYKCMKGKRMYTFKHIGNFYEQKGHERKHLYREGIRKHRANKQTDV